MKKQYGAIALACCLAAAVILYLALGVTQKSQQSQTHTSSTEHATDTNSGPEPTAGTTHQQTSPSVDLYVQEFGVTTGKAVNKGFVFFEGRYIDAPYVVTRKGLGIFVNDTMVYPPPHKWPLKEPPSGDVEPRIPSSIRKDTSQYDRDLTDYLQELAAYIHKHYRLEEQPKIFEQAYRKLPCVKEANLDPQDPQLLIMRTFKGETSRIRLTPRGRRRRTDKASVLAGVEGKRRNLEERLEKGDCYFFFRNGGEFTFGAGLVTDWLPRAVSILRSDKPEETKLREIKQVGMEFSRLGEVVQNFAASAQLEERLAKTGGAN